ncbi:MarR family winged helix-turn-helix transcriptional regulator [Sulfobacillus sp. hq2]|uniref:MarR family winged helix-turn-helix transcriptional regulator n=1 Tax=Sulfobacillus sp. hq2 TaxID=2039167 RepID=UPI001304CAD6|nr:MarR family transcriptional regulator [Sulfobacillus sp. hq2]
MERNDRSMALHIFFDAILTAEPILEELSTTHHLSLAQIRCLFQLRTGPKTAGALAKALGIRATSLTRLTQGLEALHWTKRRSDVHDRRLVVISLTQKGQEMLADLDFFIHSSAAQAIARLQPAERQDFIHILMRYLDYEAAIRHACD